MVDFDVCQAGARRFIEHILERSPNGETLAVQFHPNGDWTVYDAPPATLLSVDDAETELNIAIGNIKIGPKTDDKSILRELQANGFWLARLPRHQWRCVNCKHIMLAAGEPERCFVCRQREFAEVATVAAPVHLAAPIAIMDQNGGELHAPPGYHFEFVGATGDGGNGFAKIVPDRG